MRKYFNTPYADSMHNATGKYCEYWLKRGDMHHYYNGWQSEIMYEINYNHFYNAMRRTVAMGQDMERRKCKDEKYSATYLMGVIFALQENIEQARKYLHQSLEEWNGKDSTDLIQIYKELANIEMEADPEEAVMYIDRTINMIKGSKMTYEYSDLLAFKTIIAFIMHDWPLVTQLSDEYFRIEKENINNFSPTYYYYVKMCRATADKSFDKATALADSLTNIDRQKFKVHIHLVKGDTIAAYKAQCEYIRAKDSISANYLTQDLTNAAFDVERAAVQIKADEARIVRIVTRISLIVAVAVILTLIIAMRKRNAYLKRMQQKNVDLEKMRHKAEEADRMKASILKNMSHEVRTPLNIITGFTELMCNPDIKLSDKERADVTERMKKGAANLISIIENLLYVASKESTDYTARIDDVSCNVLCRKLLDEFRGQTADGVELTFSTNIDDKQTILTNEPGLSKVLEHLLDNASKFTTKGHIALDCSYNSTIRNVTFTVTDTGCGIDPEHAKHLFDLFYKVDNSRDGLGIGLPLAQNIAMQLCGDIVLDTDYHDGARFVVTLPEK